MKRIVLSLLIPISCCLTAWGQKNNICPMGDYRLQATQDPTKEQVGEASSSWQLSYDPNEIIGPTGYDSVRWVSINDVLNYTVLFENDPEFATAAAQKVDVRFGFPNKSWMKGFGIGGYSFANMSFPVAKPSNAYQQRIDLRDSLGYYVDLIGGLDVARQQGFWNFSTIDPETGYAPWQSEMGLLPVNDETHVGEGFVTFQLKPYEGLKTGDTISIQANIMFDQNDTIPTNRWCNKIDAGMPESKVTAELHPTLPNIYNLKFTGKDDEGGSGVKHILLYLANHSGIYEEIDTCMVDSILAFPVEVGKQYKLYSIAVDNTGNREPAKMEPDVILNFNQAPTDIALSDTIFQDDLPAGGYVGKLSSIDTEDNKIFTYTLTEGEGAIHNELFTITDDLLQTKESFKCAADTTYFVRICTTDDGGLSFSKSFVLHMNRVLGIPKADTTAVSICEGDVYLFHEREYDKAGVYTYVKDNDFSCDSVYRLILTVMPRSETPLVTIENNTTLVSSAAKGNQWFYGDGTPIEGATEQKFTPTADGTYYVAVYNGICYSEPSQVYRVKLTDKMDLQMNLAEGWNWISTNLSDTKYQSTEGFLAPILDNVDRMESVNSEMVNDNNGMNGNLKTVLPQESYKLKMNKNVSGEWSGTGYQPQNTPIALHKGWNWIGYIPVSENSVTNALSNLSPSENDVIKTLDAFAIYDGSTWQGTLKYMKPGEGYMYYSFDEKQFTYPATRIFAIDNNVPEANETSPAPWTYDKHEYRDNKTLIAELYANETKAMEGIYTVGAFVGNECRGVGTYIDGQLYITVHGTHYNNETISFKAYDNITSEELSISETLSMDGMQTGTTQTPYVLHMTGSTDISSITSSYNVYPNPVRGTMYINGDSSQILDVKLVSTNGKTVLSVNGYSDNGINVQSLLEGIYVVAIHTNMGYQYEKIIIAH